MEAKDLIKKDTILEYIYSDIKSQNDAGYYKTFIPNQRYVDELSICELINKGFKVYKGDWDGIMKDCYIIEW